jgi:toxin HigB-1
MVAAAVGLALLTISVSKQWQKPNRCRGMTVDYPYTDAIHYTRMIRSFRHKGVEQFFRTGTKAKIQPKHADKPKHADRLKLQLAALDNSKSEKDMNAPGWRLHPLYGNLENHWSVEVSGNWRLTFRFEGEDAVLVDYQDYH